MNLEHFIYRTKFSKDCWEWTGNTLLSGYGAFRSNGKQIRAHRWMYEKTFGPIPKGKVVCHICDNPKCVKPSHLWLGSQKENIHDASQKGRMKRYCKRGHWLSKKNTYYAKDKYRSRICRICNLITQRQRKQKEK